jgi:hypothetical protein
LQEGRKKLKTLIDKLGVEFGQTSIQIAAMEKQWQRVWAKLGYSLEPLPWRN